MFSGQINKSQINIDLIKIIQFCLKFYDLWRHSQLWVGGKVRFEFMICGDTPIGGCVHSWMDGWVIVWVNGWGHANTKY